MQHGQMEIYDKVEFRGRWMENYYEKTSRIRQMLAKPT
jgi:hypothetical protein